MLSSNRKLALVQVPLTVFIAPPGPFSQPFPVAVLFWAVIQLALIPLANIRSVEAENVRDGVAMSAMFSDSSTFNPAACIHKEQRQTVDEADQVSRWQTGPRSTVPTGKWLFFGVSKSKTHGCFDLAIFLADGTRHGSSRIFRDWSETPMSRRSGVLRIDSVIRRPGSGHYHQQQPHLMFRAATEHLPAPAEKTKIPPAHLTDNGQSLLGSVFATLIT